MFKSVFSLTGAALVLSTSSLSGQVAPHYRDFALGSTLSTVSAQVKASASDVKPIHQRPG
jgi:hypothetical protein